MPAPDEAAPVRDAATVILYRDTPDGPAVLMGQRGAAAAFMPSKYVFPGGASDPGDRLVPLASPLPLACAARVDTWLAATAIRELWEETGLVLGVPGVWPGEPPDGWREFAAAGAVPSAAALRFVFRAITPPGRTRRFDARFFLADAARLLGDPDDFSRATDELSHLHWVPLDAARHLSLPFITEVVLAEIAPLLSAEHVPERVAFFDNSGPASRFRWIA